MKKSIFLLFIIMFSSITFIIAQSSSDTITIGRSGEFYLNRHHLDRRELKPLMQQYDESYIYYRKSISNLRAGKTLTVLGLIAGVGGWGFTDNSTKYIVVGTGVGLMTTGIYFLLKSYVNKLTAVKIYNTKKIAEQESISFNVSAGFTNNGAGIIIRF